MPPLLPELLLRSCRGLDTHFVPQGYNALLDLISSNVSVHELFVSMYRDKAFDRLPIIADVLEEMGGNDADLLFFCRNGAIISGRLSGWQLQQRLYRFRDKKVILWEDASINYSPQTSRQIIRTTLSRFNVTHKKKVFKHNFVPTDKRNPPDFTTEAKLIVLWTSIGVLYENRSHCS